MAVRDENVYYKCTNAGAVFVERTGEDICLLLLASEWLNCVGRKLYLYVQIRLVTRTEMFHTPESIQSILPICYYCCVADDIREFLPYWYCIIPLHSLCDYPDPLVFYEACTTPII